MAIPKVLCMTRIDAEIVQRYSGKVRNAILEYRSICDELVIVKHESLKHWQGRAELIAKSLVGLNP
jgi:hypothetical protein